ncbi:helix-turn-helix transcriptional regulator [Streptomyces griseus]|uniref:helix-turn-helix domain-containing protein n=1 Tax=Streptomyces griseus TaxID=1911 RepID=UPI00056D489E|nr:helix-turn-helix transcriptional regulator [Streptomyces griseus]
MPRGDDVAEFAALLTELKARTDRSYGSLARRLNMNTSTLHRYCAGEAVPQDFAPVERLAVFCGASAEERLELHRRWLLAVAARQRPRGGAEAEAAVRENVVRSAERPPPAQAGDAAEPPATTAPAEPTEPATAPRPWYRRRRVTVSAAAACALLATLGGLAALPSDHPSGGDAARRPGASSTLTRTSPSPPTASPSRSTSPSPSPSASGSKNASPRSATSGKTADSPAPSTSSTAHDGNAPVVVPLAWTADSQVWQLGCGHDYVIDKAPAQVPPPPVAQDAGTWAATQNAVHGRETNVRISVQGRSSTAVVLEALRVRVVGRAQPTPGNAYAMDQGCGGSISPRYFAVNLDADRPIARSVPGSDEGTPIPAVRLPYRVSAEDPEVLLVTARTEGCDCRWYLELDWSSQGHSGTVRIDDRGRPFRTTGIKGLPRYMYDTSERHWRPYS